MVNKLIDFKKEEFEQVEYLRLTNSEDYNKVATLQEQRHILNKCKNLIQCELEELCEEIKHNNMNINLFVKKFKKRNREILTIQSMINKIAKQELKK